MMTQRKGIILAGGSGTRLYPVWNDSAIDIKWPINGEPILSAKDQQAKTLATAEHFA